jgi:hypothetical protein
MKRRPQERQRATPASRARKLGKPVTRSTKTAKPDRDHPSGRLETMLSLIRARPGIRPSEINRLLNLEQSDGLRSTLIKRRLIRKEKDGSAMRYYPV